MKRGGRMNLPPFVVGKMRVYFKSVALFVDENPEASTRNRYTPEATLAPCWSVPFHSTS
jgi:hypothetical protein